MEVNNNVVFTGFGIKGVAPAKVVKEFLNNPNNIKLIEELETKNIDILMSEKGKKLNFVSTNYGDLSNYGLADYVVEGFDKVSSNVSKFMKTIDKACFKALKSTDNYKNKSDEIVYPRGC